MPIRAAAAIVVFASVAARAGEVPTAIAPVTTGQSAPPELQRAFSEELPRALGAAGFALVPPNEVDMKVGERPELLQCKSGGCLAEEATFLNVGRLALPRLERAADGSFTVGITIYDAGQKKAVADGVDRVATAGEMHEKLVAMAERLHAELSRPGRLEVSARPAATLTVDGQAVGTTPWAGELAAGDHVVALESAGARVERDVSVAPGGTARVDVELAQPAPLPPPRHNRALAPIKWTAFVAGLAAVGAGAALVAIDGHGTCTPLAGQRQCPSLFDTRTGGIAALASGGALVVTSVVLFVVDRPRR